MNNMRPFCTLTIKKDKAQKGHIFHKQHPKDMADECHELSSTTFLIHHGIDDDVTDIFLDACASLHFLKISIDFQTITVKGHD